MSNSPPPSPPPSPLLSRSPPFIAVLGPGISPVRSDYPAVMISCKKFVDYVIDEVLKPHGHLDTLLQHVLRSSNENMDSLINILNPFMEDLSDDSMVEWASDKATFIYDLHMDNEKELGYFTKVCARTLVLRELLHHFPYGPYVSRDTTLERLSAFDRKACNLAQIYWPEQLLDYLLQISATPWMAKHVKGWCRNENDRLEHEKSDANAQYHLSSGANFDATPALEVENAFEDNRELIENADLFHRLIELTINWNDLNSRGLQHAELRDNLPSSYNSFEVYEQKMDAVILADFHLELCESAHRPRGHPVWIEHVGEKEKYPGLRNCVSYFVTGIKFNCVLYVHESGFAFYHHKMQRLILSERCDHVFSSKMRRGQPHFTGISIGTPIARMLAVRHINTLRETRWYTNILTAHCIEPVIYKHITKCHERAMWEFIPEGQGIFLWQGPPGTGKTKAVATLIMDLLQRFRPMKKTLICAHSNQSVLNIAKQLIKIGVQPECIQWHVSKQRLIERQHHAWELQMINRPEDRLDNVKIWLSTCSGARKIKIKTEIVIVDEAAFCPEVDGLVAFSTLDTSHSSYGKILLVGDCAQLPPVMKMFNHPQPNASFMGRCCAVSSLRCVSSFDISYRIGPDAAHFLKEHVYTNIPTFKSSLETIPQMNILKNGTPFAELTFIDVQHGRESLKGRSWENHLEAVEICTIVHGLTLNGVFSNDIVIITPYEAQKNMVITTIKTRAKDMKLSSVVKKNLLAIKVSTVHEMQGSERKFVIISTVRTEKVGFIDDSHLECVAISRQKVFLVVVGNAVFIQQSKVWKKFVEYLRSIKRVIPCGSLEFAH